MTAKSMQTRARLAALSGQKLLAFEASNQLLSLAIVTYSGLEIWYIGLSYSKQNWHTMDVSMPQAQKTSHTIVAE